jgi:hypothetical protein
MRLVVQEKALRTILAWSQRLLFAGAIVLLGYGGYVLADTWLFQRRESRQFERLLDQRQALTVPAALTSRLRVRDCWAVLKSSVSVFPRW